MTTSKKMAVFFAPLVSGILLTAAFPKFNFAWLAWVALVPLFSVMHDRPWRAGFSAGVVFYAVLLVWVNNVMTTYGQLPWPVSIALYLLLVAYLAAYWGAICWCSCRIETRLRLPLIVVLPIVWLVFEYGRNFFFTGFPWGNIAYSQTIYPSLIQSADLAGVSILVFLIVVVNCALSSAWQMWRSGKLVPWRLLCVVSVLWMANYGYGVWRLGSVSDQVGEPVRIALIQGNIAQSLKWNPNYLPATLATYTQLSSAVETADLLVWPESATPFFFQDGGSKAHQVQALARKRQAMLLFGSPAYKIVAENTAKQAARRYKYLNSAYLMSAQGQTIGRSDKTHLVPFGEYVPLSWLLSFVDKLVAGVGDFVPGVKHLLPLGGHEVGLLVCYEAIFPEIARNQVRTGAQLLINITNDAWFGDSAAPWQHLAMTQWRAVENRLWIARCANSGVSAFIDPLGRVTQHSQLFRAETVVGDIYFSNHTSLYTRTGDSVALLFSAVVLIWLWQSRRRKSIDCA